MSYLIDKLKRLESMALALCRSGAGPLGRFVRQPGKPPYTPAELDQHGASDEQRRIADQVEAMDAATTGGRP